MLIRSLQVSNFKRLIGLIQINGLVDGINIIAGDNEEGKSTLLQAIKALVLQKHSAKNAVTSEYRPYNAAVRPTVSMELEFGGNKYSMSKAFCSKPAAQFKSSQGIFADSEAEEKIRELFGLKGIEKDAGIWGLLWLEQGTAEDGLGTTGGGRETIMRALDSNLSTVLAGQKGRALLKNIDAQYSKSYTATNKERGELLKSADELQEREKQLQECQARFVAYEQKLGVLQAKQQQQTQLEKDRTLDTLKQAAAGVEAEYKKFETLNLKVVGEASAESAALLTYKEAKRVVDERVRLQSKQIEAKELQSKKETLLQEKNSSQCQASQQLDTANAELTAAADLRSSAEIDCRIAERKEAFQRLSQSRTEVENKYNLWQKLEQQVADWRKQLEAIQVSDEKIRKLRQLEQERIAAEVRCSASSTKIVLTPDAKNKAIVDGKEFSAAAEFSVSTRTTLKLEGWGSVDVIPGGEKTAEYAEALKARQAALKKALSELGADSIEDAEELLREAKVTQLSLDSVLREQIALGGKTGIKGLELQLKNIEDDLSNYSKVELGEFAKETAPLEQLRKTLQSHRADEAKCAAIVNTNKELLNSISLSIKGLQTEIVGLQSALKDSEQQLANLSPNNREADLLVLSEAEERLALASAKHKTSKVALEAMDEKTILSRKDEITKKHSSIEQLVKQLREDIIQLNTEINSVGQSGLGDELAQLKGEVELARKNAERVRAQAQALKLLRDTLLQAEESMKARVLQPVLDILQPHLHELFPGSELQFDQSSIEISEFTRDGVAESYKKLSTGTREQISVLTRIALAQLLKRQGQASVLLLDDALVYSDATRFAKMKQLLKEVSNELQILILTCRLRDYSDIPGANIIEFSNAGSLSVSR